MKEGIARILAGQVKLSEKELVSLIEVPKDSSMGDYAFPCFSLAKILKKNPVQIASELKDKMKKQKGFERIEAVGPYLNFFLDRSVLAQETISAILKEKEKYGSSGSQKGKKILIEFSSPNIAKPFGIGHLRSTIIGNSLANLAEFEGAKVVRLNYLGDWGTQFGKLIIGYEKWGNEKKLKADPINHLLDLYVWVNSDKDLEQPARDAFRKLEEGNKKYIAMWKRFRESSLFEFKEIYKNIGIKFDVFSGESEYNEKKDDVLNLLKRAKLLKESEGALVVDLESKGLGVCLIQKGDGATLYATRDLAAAIDRHIKYKFDSMLYEVGVEQTLHFRQIFALLDLLGFNWAKNCMHIRHGLYLDSDGKKFATRKGKTVFMEDILSETESLAEAEIKKRTKLSAADLKKRAHAIAIAAIFYGDLKNYRENDMVFDLDRFISFDGDTGPYLLYSYARAKSILRKSKFKTAGKLTDLKLSDSEKAIITSLSNFPETIESAFEQKAPHLVAHYAYSLAQQFNEWYHQDKIIGSEKEKQGLIIVAAYSQVLKNSLSLLGIPVLEKM